MNQFLGSCFCGLQEDAVGSKRPSMEYYILPFPNNYLFDVLFLVWWWGRSRRPGGFGGGGGCQLRQPKF